MSTLVPNLRWFHLGFFDSTVSESDTRSVETTLHILNSDLSWASDMPWGGILSRNAGGVQLHGDEGNPLMLGMAVCSQCCVLSYHIPSCPQNTHLCPLLLGERGRQWLEMEHKRIVHLWAPGML